MYHHRDFYLDTISSVWIKLIHAIEEVLFNDTWRGYDTTNLTIERKKKRNECIRDMPCSETAIFHIFEVKCGLKI